MPLKSEIYIYIYIYQKDILYCKGMISDLTTGMHQSFNKVNTIMTITILFAFIFAICNSVKNTYPGHMTNFVFHKSEF